jgi:uncharacterized protein YbaP (TraB family)
MQAWLRRRRRTAAILVFLPLLAAAQEIPGKSVLLWRIDSGPSTVFLLGSVHVAREDIYPLSDYIETAFASAARLAVEVDITRMDQASAQKKLLELGVLPREATLSVLLGPELAGKVREKLESLGLPDSAFERFKPWLVYMTLAAMDLADLGYGGENGVDLHFLRRAGNREIVELESLDFQLELLAGFSDQEQRELLSEYLEESVSLPEETAALFDAWIRGDNIRLSELLSLQPDKSAVDLRIEEVLLRRRDAEMAKKVRGLLDKPGVSFVVVGAAHLAGPGSVVDLLGKSGYRVVEIRE